MYYEWMSQYLTQQQTFMQQRIRDVIRALTAANLPSKNPQGKAFGMLQASYDLSTHTFLVNAMVSVPPQLAALDIQKLAAAPKCPVMTTSQVAPTIQTTSSTTLLALPSPQNVTTTANADSTTSHPKHPLNRSLHSSCPCQPLRRPGRL